MATLEEMGLTKDLILAGEVAELEPVKPKMVGDKNEYLLKAHADEVINAYAKDLQSALKRIDELEMEAQSFQSLFDQIENKEKDLVEIRNGLSDMGRMQSENKNRISQYEGELSTAHSTIDDLTSRINEMKDKLTTVENNLQSSNDLLLDRENEIEQLKQYLDENDAVVNNLEAGVNQVLDDLYAAADRYGVKLRDYRGE